jgi:hypothetical protein
VYSSIERDSQTQDNLTFQSRIHNVKKQRKLLPFEKKKEKRTHDMSQDKSTQPPLNTSQATSPRESQHSPSHRFINQKTKTSRKNNVHE